MSKKMDPIDGVRAQDFLLEFKSEKNEKIKVDEKNINFSVESRRSITNFLHNIMKQVNKDVCLSDYQVMTTKSTILSFFSNNPNSGDIERYQLEILTYLNSIRLECSNCLNSQCEFRDPDV